jgi:hypothetical protein
MESQPWRAWPDWVNVVLGVFFAVSSLFVTNMSFMWSVILGAVVALVALWALATAAPQLAEWVQVVAGVVTFISPWIGGFASGLAGWIAWGVGIVVILLALWSIYQPRSTKA